MNICKDFFFSLCLIECYSFPVMCSTFESRSSAGDSSSESSFSQGTTTLCYKDARKQATVAHFLEFMFLLL